ncbi:PAP2 superfamily protein [Dyadobacter jejuensis]|uniref:PAP2 superfamily protein n=1 Tax=Dyadobacter jejuensis TaxID=1082580 RepID=A0A316ACY0_9BACT|nr:phosphatase PAP2 family protein [Dyadobacter jejuensis]PWJ55259.1 PAP2 superfamily protein [Dyadobacter jejuensis]
MKSIVLSRRLLLTCFCLVWVAFGLLQAVLGQNNMVLAINAHWSPFLDHTIPPLTFLGDGVFCVVLGLLALIGSYRLGISILISYIVSGLLVQFLKRVVYADAYRPPVVLAQKLPYLHHTPGIEWLHHGSFPSGHTTSAFAVFMCLALFSKYKTIQFICLLLAIIVAFSRMYLLAHFPADVWIGAMIGLGFALGSTFACKYWFQRLPARALDSGAWNV